MWVTTKDYGDILIKSVVDNINLANMPVWLLTGFNEKTAVDRIS